MRDWLATGNVIGESPTSVVGLYTRLSGCSIEPLESFERLAVGKASPAEDRAEAASSRRLQLFFVPFSIPER